VSLFGKLFGGGEREPELPGVPADQLVLHTLKPGWLVDFDGQSWQVMDRIAVELKTGQATEWVLRCAVAEVRLQHDVRFGQESWEMLVQIPVEALGPDVRRAVVYEGDPPEEAEMEGRPLALDPEKRAGHYRRDDGRGGPEGFIAWTYRDEQGEPWARVEQLSEAEVRAYSVSPVAEYQFTNVLPGSLS
jgi:Domain of unknown function (DUF4178)